LVHGLIKSSGDPKSFPRIRVSIMSPSDLDSVDGKAFLNYEQEAGRYRPFGIMLDSSFRGRVLRDPLGETSSRIKGELCCSQTRKRARRERSSRRGSSILLRLIVTSFLLRSAFVYAAIIRKLVLFAAHLLFSSIPQSATRSRDRTRVQI